MASHVQRMADRNQAVNIWTAKIIPIVLAGVVGYATYVLVALLCVNYLLVKHNDRGAAIPILVIYFLLFIPMAASFFRVVYITAVHPPYVPLGPAASRDNANGRENGVGAGEYNLGNYRNDIDAPGLELFYSKDIFVCEQDGKPIWCSHCGNWKPDRAHHDSSSGRCIAKMDHFCPWVGGPVGENNFKYFIQFVFWTALYCLHLLIVMAIYTHKQLTTKDEHLSNHFPAILALAGFFFLFTASMTGTSVQLVLQNLTSVERLSAKTKLYTLAVKKPAPEELEQISRFAASNPSYNVVTYPLEPGQPPRFERTMMRQPGTPDVVPYVDPNQVVQNPDSSSGPSLHGQAGTYPPTRPDESVTPNNPRVEGAPSSPSSSAMRTSAPEDISLGAVSENGAPRERVTARDLQATKTFAILNMLEPGDNPWDLGSRYLNWKSVMGTNGFDWFLPFRQSPCCNHEDPESHFELGPTVESLRARHHFVTARNPHPPPRRNRFLRRPAGKDLETGNGSESTSNK